jgi:hypothetical protein
MTDAKNAANSANLELWGKVCTTNPLNTKNFKRAGGFGGTAINPTYLIQRATEIFGPMGIDWGTNVIDERYQDGAPIVQAGVVLGFEKIHVLRLELWYQLNGKKGVVQQFGQTTFVGKNSYGYFTDEEAPKKSMTDALTKCLSLLGFGADIHLGMYDDVKYVNELKEQFSGSSVTPSSQAIQVAPNPMVPQAKAAVAIKAPAKAPSLDDKANTWILATRNSVSIDQLERANVKVDEDFASRADLIAQIKAEITLRKAQLTTSAEQA